MAAMALSSGYSRNVLHRERRPRSRRSASTPRRTAAAQIVQAIKMHMFTLLRSAAGRRDLKIDAFHSNAPSEGRRPNLERLLSVPLAEYLINV